MSVVQYIQLAYCKIQYTKCKSPVKENSKIKACYSTLKVVQLQNQGQVEIHSASHHVLMLGNLVNFCLPFKIFIN